MRTERDLILDPYLLLYLPLHKLDGSSFMSRDAYGHLCTVTGTLWTPAGRSFDGVDDTITFPLQDLSSGSHTILVWIKVGGFAAYPHIVSAFNQTYRYVRFHNDGSAIYIENSNDTDTATLTYAFSTDTWYFIAIPYDGSTEHLYVNGDYKTSDGMAGGNVFDRIGGGRYLPGTVGVFMIYNRFLTGPDIQRLYLATK